MARANRRRCLPAEMVEEILIRLPVKSLIRFRCVSKSWHSFISDPNFVRRHFNRAAQPDNLSQKTLMLSNPEESPNNNVRFSCFLVDSLPSLPVKVRRRKYCPCPFNGDSWLLLSYLDGLLCVFVDRSIYIWNPCFNAYKKILTPKDTYLVQLGYDSATNDYQLFKISADNIDEPETFETGIYSVKSESWRKLNDFPKDYFPMRSVFVNGSFYWLADGDYYDRPIAYTLFSFDLSDNEYREVSLPEKCPTNLHRIDVAELCVLRGMLCLLVLCDNSFLILWAMKDCSDRKSWTKVLDIPLVRISDDVMSVPTEYKPFYMYKDGEVLVGIVSNRGTEVLICKGDDVLFRKIIYRKPYNIHYGLLHVESLISLKELN